MQVFPLIILAAIFSGAIITYILARRRADYVQLAAIFVQTTVLLLWLLLYRSLPITLTFHVRVPPEPFLLWNLRVDHAAWQLSLYLLLLIEAILLVGLPGIESAETTTNWPLAKRIRLPAILGLTGIAMLALWSDSFAGLISSWTLLALVWMLLLWSVGVEKINLSTLFWRAGGLLLGVLFLWMAAISIPGAREMTLNDIEWSSSSLLWALLAAFTFLGAIPIFWWRPFDKLLPISTSALIHIVPAVAGASLLSRLNVLGNGNNTMMLFVTLFGLVSLIVGCAFAWRHIENASLALPYLVLAQAGLIAILGAWVGPDPVIAATRVLILAVGGLFLTALIPQRRLAWFAVIPIAALAGLPLTAGFSGLAPLYDAWLESGRFSFVLITSLLFVPFVAAAILVSFKNGSNNHMGTSSTSMRIRYIVGLLLPTIGLLTFPNLDLSELNWISVVAIVLATILGVALSQYSKLVGKIQANLNSAKRLNLPQEDIYLTLISITKYIGVIIRAAATIFEGEGGMLWLLVLILIAWLARGG